MSATKTRRPRLSVTRLEDRLTPSAAVAAPRVTAYYAEWDTYARNYQVSDIPADKLTDLIYSFAQIQNNQVTLDDAYAATQKPLTYDGKSYLGNLSVLQAVKADHPQLKTLIAIGGWTLSDPFPTMAASASSRATFVNSAVAFMRQYGFDGVDIDWEYPVSGGLDAVGTAADKHNFTLLMQDLRAGLTAAGNADGKTYLLTAAMGAGAGVVPNNYEIGTVAKSLDWIDVMSYDYHGSGWEKQTNNQAALTPDPSDPSSGANVNNVEWSIQQYLNAGVPASKLQMGVPLYGRTWENVPAGTTNGLYQTSTGVMDPADVTQDTVVGPGTWERGVLDYKDLYNRLQTQPSTYHLYWDAAAQEPYVYATSAVDTSVINATTGQQNNQAMPNVFSTYEDPQSLALKINYAKQEGLGGVFFWELSGDLPESNPNSLVRVAADSLLMPSVQGVQVNAGAAQRSMVTSVQVTFSSVVTIAPGAFTLTYIAAPVGPSGSLVGAVNSTVGGFTVSTSTVGGVTVANLSGFTGTDTFDGSLIDGRYSLTVNHADVTANGVAMASDFTYADSGSTSGNQLYRFFGDINGSRTVGNAAFGFFRLAFGSQAQNPNYNAAFDYTGVGTIGNAAFGFFRLNFGFSI